MTKRINEQGLAQIGANAAERYVDQHRFYVVTLLPIQLADWGDILGAIEAEGWYLDQFAFGREGHAVAVFHRM